MARRFREEEVGKHDSAPAPCADGLAPFRIDRDGGWWHEGRPIRRPALVRLLATVLRREADGGYWLATPYERVAVEDAPFLAVELHVEGAGEAQRLRLRTSLDQEVEIGPDHPLLLRPGADGVPLPYVPVHPGLDARLARPVYYELVERGVERDGPCGRELGVWSGGHFFPLGRIAD